MKFYGTEYRVGAVVRTGSTNNLSQFASIEHIVVLSQDNIYFVVKAFVTKGFTSHFHAYEVQGQHGASYLILQQNEFYGYAPTHTVKPVKCISYNDHVVIRYI